MPVAAGFACVCRCWRVCGAVSWGVCCVFAVTLGGLEAPRPGALGLPCRLHSACIWAGVARCCWFFSSTPLCPKSVTGLFPRNSDTQWDMTILVVGGRSGGEEWQWSTTAAVVLSSGVAAAPQWLRSRVEALHPAQLPPYAYAYVNCTRYGPGTMHKLPRSVVAVLRQCRLLAG